MEKANRELKAYCSKCEIKKTPNGLEVFVAPTFDVSGKPSWANEAYYFWVAMDKVCQTDYPSLKPVKVVLAWADAYQIHEPILDLKGVKADFCSKVENLRGSNLYEILKGYALLRQTAHLAEVKDAYTFRQMCEEAGGNVLKGLCP